MFAETKLFCEYYILFNGEGTDERAADIGGRAWRSGRLPGSRWVADNGGFRLVTPRLRRSIRSESGLESCFGQRYFVSISDLTRSRH
jgi:hypothetical protein